MRRFDLLSKLLGPATYEIPVRCNELAVAIEVCAAEVGDQMVGSFPPPAPADWKHGDHAYWSPPEYESPLTLFLSGRDPGLDIFDGTATGFGTPEERERWADNHRVLYDADPAELDWR
jgi:hypothetical protein